MEGLLSVYVKCAHGTWSISAFTVKSMRSARALKVLRASARRAFSMIREEAVGVCLHDGHRVTLRRLVNWMCVPIAFFVVNMGEEDARGALAGHLRKVDIEGESAA